MWQLIPTILYLTYVQGNPPIKPPPYNSQYPAYGKHERTLASNYYVPPGQTSLQTPYNVPVKPYSEYPAVDSLNYNYQQYPQLQAQYHEFSFGTPEIYEYLRQSPPQKQNLFSEMYPFDLDYGSHSEIDDSKSVPHVAAQSYFDDLELTENFGNYLKRRTLMDGSSTVVNDAAHQYNALLAVILALARAVRISCTDFDQVYDQMYQSIVETYYTYGLNNAEKVYGIIEDYIRKGHLHMPKLRKLKQELCKKDLFCSVSFNSKIKSAPLMYVKELETLEALSRLALSYYRYIEEFNQVAQKCAVLPYLQNSKDRLREYVMHVVNSIEHLTDKRDSCP